MLEFKLLEPAAQEDPDVHLIKQPLLKVSPAQRLEAEGVKSEDVGEPFKPGQRLADTRGHFSRGLFRIGERQDVFRLQTRNTVQKVHDALGDDPRLSTTGPGNHQQRALAMCNRVALCRIEFEHEIHCTHYFATLRVEARGRSVSHDRVTRGQRALPGAS